MGSSGLPLYFPPPELDSSLKYSQKKKPYIQGAAESAAAGVNNTHGCSGCGCFIWGKGNQIHMAEPGDRPSRYQKCLDLGSHLICGFGGNPGELGCCARMGWVLGRDGRWVGVGAETGWVL